MPKITGTIISHQLFVFGLIDDLQLRVSGPALLAEVLLDVLRLLLADFDAVAVIPFFAVVTAAEEMKQSFDS